MDTDLDATPDYRDLDSDNDKVFDILEVKDAPLDGVKTGIIDAPADSDGDGVRDVGDDSDLAPSPARETIIGDREDSESLLEKAQPTFRKGYDDIPDTEKFIANEDEIRKRGARKAAIAAQAEAVKISKTDGFSQVMPPEGKYGT